MLLSITITGLIDVPDDWDGDADFSAIDVADYRYNNQLTVENTLRELTEKLAIHPSHVEVNISHLPEGGKNATWHGQ